MAIPIDRATFPSPPFEEDRETAQMLSAQASKHDLAAGAAYAQRDDAAAVKHREFAMKLRALISEAPSFPRKTR